MHTYKLIIAYDGTDFHGWQEQVHPSLTLPTVVSALKATFKTVFHQDVSILGASRTDSGVHAQGQVARAQTTLDIDPTAMMMAWNYRLPLGIQIRAVFKVSNDFNPRLDVQQKTYTYRLFKSFPDPWIGRFGWLYPFIKDVNIDTFEKALQLYKGKHDFTSFCKYQKTVSPIRTVDSIELIDENLSTPSWLVIIKGPSFAHYQIRRMIGYAADASRHPKTALTTIQHRLDNPCDTQTLTKAGASGLTLQHIEYKDGTET